MDDVSQALLHAALADAYERGFRKGMKDANSTARPTRKPRDAKAAAERQRARAKRVLSVAP